ncbi:MAG: hypothetical protein AB7N91_28580 [Candidatus Tectimicrobiota bacterium]
MTWGVLSLSIICLWGLPLLGASLAGRPLALYLEFPPLTRAGTPAPFSWSIFTLFACLIGSSIAPLVWRVLRSRPRQLPSARPRHFPAWGWAGLGLGAVAWVLAWTRFPWFAPWQLFTFTPLWLAYVLVVNALTMWRTGHCNMLDRPRAFLWLFPASALFWWYFEYANRFVQNWFYLGGETLSPWQYFWCATLPFSTVLPAVRSTYELLQSCPRLSAGLAHYLPLQVQSPRLLGLGLLGLGSFGLLGISLWPDYCYPLVWVGPLLILTSWQALLRLPTIFAPLQRGDWRTLWLWALAALVCGFWWEMWNMYSLGKWVYTVPFVNRFHLFEMPLLGYGGYIPFGLECAAVLALLPGTAPEPAVTPGSIQRS